jgi:hypothetical protein
MRLKNDGRQKPTYICPKKCGFRRLKAGPVDQIIWKTARQYFVQNLDLLRDTIAKSKDSGESKRRQQDIADIEAQLTRLEKAKRGIQASLKIDPDDLDALHDLAENRAERAEWTLKLANAKAQAQPFSEVEPLKIAKALARRFHGSDAWSIGQKRDALSEVVQAIAISRHNDELKAEFIVRGSLPLPYEHATIENLS